MRNSLIALALLTACGPTTTSSPSSSAMGTSSASANPTSSATARPTPTPSASVEEESEGPPTDEGAYGSLVDEKEFGAAVSVLPPSAFADPPAKPGGAVPAQVLLTNLPAISRQGTKKGPGYPGSCEAQSFGYGLGSYTAARALDGHALWDASLPENEPSAAFLYAWLHKIAHQKCGDGSGATQYLSRLVSLGAPSVEDVPYKPACPYLAGDSYLDKPFGGEDRLRIGSFATFSINKNKLSFLKELLAGGQAVAFSGLVIKGFNTIPLDTGVVYSTETYPKSGHGMLLVGYDDARGRPDKPGAFLIQNSFGPDWPSPGAGGRVWYSYDTFLTTQFLGATAYPRDPSPPKGQMLKGAPGAPAASITRAFQWTPDARTVLVLMHHFAEPLLMKSITLTGPGGKSVTGTLNQFIQSGYTHFARSDGKSFALGDWKVVITGEDAAGAAVTYEGTVKLGAPSPEARPASALEGAIAGPTGAPATLK